ncbi:hypothetical protein LWI28_004841 [Acer negundo]|uniref:Uncharacterized protein n=1 Tax=Acer negundo TaxID=4023 RepID=A0AAD5NZE2_ACENE|nr:hypothetical protein LWI28_004841 [Acer negundo]
MINRFHRRSGWGLPLDFLNLEALAAFSLKGERAVGRVESLAGRLVRDLAGVKETEEGYEETRGAEEEIPLMRSKKSRANEIDVVPIEKVQEDTTPAILIVGEKVSTTIPYKDSSVAPPRVDLVPQAPKPDSSNPTKYSTEEELIALTNESNSKSY